MRNFRKARALRKIARAKKRKEKTINWAKREGDETAKKLLLRTRNLNDTFLNRPTITQLANGAE